MEDNKKTKEQLITGLSELRQRIFELENSEGKNKGAEGDSCVDEKCFETIFKEASLGIALIDSLNGKIYEVNPKYAEICGRTQRNYRSIKK